MKKEFGGTGNNQPKRPSFETRIPLNGQGKEKTFLSRWGKRTIDSIKGGKSRTQKDITGDQPRPDGNNQDFEQKIPHLVPNVNEQSVGDDIPQIFAQTISFMQPFDGKTQISHAEKELVAQTFTSYFDDVLLNHPEEISSYRDGMCSVEKDIELLQMKRELEDGSKINISFNRRVWEGKLRRNILLQHVINNTNVEQYGYQLYEDGMVTRSHSSKEQQEMARKTLTFLTGNESLEEIMKTTEASLEESSNEVLNSNLETAMGIDNGPIGLVELQGLMDLVDGATAFMV